MLAGLANNHCDGTQTKYLVRVHMAMCMYVLNVLVLVARVRGLY